MTKKSTIPVLLLTGYLGSGKTTLLNRILTNRRGIKFAVIVNDIGEVNIDASLIQKGGIVGGAGQDDLVALQNGCICCTLKMDLIKQLTDIAESHKFDYIVIEASGICEPEPIAQSICMIPRMLAGSANSVIPQLDCIVTVVDALRMSAEFGDGSALQRENIDDEDLENLVIQQIEFCNIILLNKISEVTAAQAAHIRSVIRAIQPKARIIDCDYADVDLDALINTGSFDYDDVATSATWIREVEGHDDDHDDDDDHDEHEHHHDHDDHDEDEYGHEHHHHHHHDDYEGEAEEYGIQTMVYYRRRPFDLNKFDYWVGKHWPKNIIRAKGIAYFDQNRDMSYIFEQAGTQKKVSEAGLWFATAPEDQLKEMMANDPTIARDWDPEVGDRMVKLVFIGQHLDRDALTATLDNLLAEK